MDEHRTIGFAIRGPISRADLRGLSNRLFELLETTQAGVLLCDVCDAGIDAVTVDALARLQLIAGRRGCRIRLRGASRDLRNLVVLMGLEDVLHE